MDHELLEHCRICARTYRNEAKLCDKCIFWRSNYLKKNSKDPISTVTISADNAAEMGDEICRRYSAEDLKIIRSEINRKLTQNESDQSVKADAGKPHVSLVPSEIIYNIARIREYGNSKYPEGGKDNWKRVDAERYRDAAYRHLLAYIDDPHGVDAESGLPHLWHLACNVAFLCELEKGAFGKEEGISYMD